AEGPLENPYDLLDGEGPQHEHLRARQQRSIHLKRGIFCRRADEDDVARLDARKEGVLLRLVESVNLVDEHDGPPARRSPELLGSAHDLSNLLDARKDCAERHEARLRRVGDDSSERGLAGAWWTPQDEGLEDVTIDGFPQRLARGQKIVLADKLAECFRPHAIRQWAGAGPAARGFFREE